MAKSSGIGGAAFLDNLAKIYGIYTGGFIFFVIALESPKRGSA